MLFNIVVTNGTNQWHNISEIYVTAIDVNLQTFLNVPRK